MRRPPLGQHFLADQAVLDQAVAAIAPRADDVFVEVGPGKGQLTRPLLASGARVIAIERDRRLAASLPGRMGEAAERLQVVEGDAARKLPAPATGPWRLVGNIPYSISSPLTLSLAGHLPRLRDVHLMVQEEFAVRLAAAAGSRSYGRLSVSVQVALEAQILFGIGQEAFRPPPQVMSSFVRLVPRARPLPVASTRWLDKVTQAAFAQRRKRLGNSLAKLRLELDAETAALRAEALDVEQYVELANQAAARHSKAP